MGFVWVPIAAYFAAYHRDWAYLYLVDTARLPSFVDVLCIASSACLLPLAYAWSLPRLTPRTHAIAVGSLLLALVLVALMVRRRLLANASWAEFHGQYAVVPLAGSSLGRGVLLSMVALAAGTVTARGSLSK
jgi:hypothetical protein